MKKFLKDWKKPLIIGAIILAFAFLLRIISLTILPVFADEAIYIRWSQIMASEATLRFLPLSDGKQPLFMWVLMFYVKRLSDPLFAGRLLSVFTGLGTSIGIFALSYSLFKNKKVSLIASLIWAVSPLAVFFDRMALVDSMLAMFGVWTLFLGVLTAKTLRLDMAMLTGFSLGFAALTKSPAIFFALLLPTTWIFAKKKTDVYKLIPLLGVSFFVAFGMYSIQRLGPNFHLLSSRTQDYVFTLDRIISNPRDPVIYNIPSAISWMIEMGPGTIVLLGIIGALRNLKKHSLEILLLSAWFLVPLVTQAAFAKVFTARYILFVIPPFFILAASSFLETKRILQKLYILLFAAFLLHALWFDDLLLTNPMSAPLPRRERMGYLEEWSSGIGIREIADFVEAEHAKVPDRKIVVGTEGYFGTLPDGLQIYLEDVPNVIVIGTGLGISELHPSLAESFDAGNKTYLVANKSRLSADPKTLGLLTLASYPKGLRSPGTMEYVNHGPQEVLYLFEVTRGTK